MSKRWWTPRWNWLPGLLILVSLSAASFTFAILTAREHELSHHVEDSASWMGAKFSYEVEALVAALGLFDGSDGQQDDLATRLEIALGRVDLMERSALLPQVDAPNLQRLRAERQQLRALEEPIAGLQAGDVAKARQLAIRAREISTAVSGITASLMQGDVRYREDLAVAVRRAQLGFVVSAVALLCSFGLMWRTLVRQAHTLDLARSALRRALDRAEAGARAKAAFLATMSHEIRTPMNGVLCAASLLAQTTLDATQRRSVDIVKLCGEALMGLLDDVLDFSALEAERIELFMDAWDIRQLAEKSCRVMEVAAGQKGIDLALVVDADVPNTLVTDGRRLGQVLINLISNGVKFTAGGGVMVRVSVRGRGASRWLRVAVIDTGAGVDFGDRTRIFEEFTRLDRRATRDVRGSGLGLSISHRIVTKMHGTLGVIGVPGRGSAFILRLPLATNQPPGDAPAAPARRLGKAAVLGGALPVRRAVEQHLLALGYRLVPPHGRPDVLLAHAAVPQTHLPQAARVLRFGITPGDAVVWMPEPAAWPDDALAGLLTQGAIDAALHATCSPSAPTTAAPTTTAPTTTAPVDTPLWVLIADDDPINREMEAQLLRHLGHHVTVVSDGVEALTALRSQTFDFALVDRHMPGLDGEDVARAIRRMESPVRLIAVTADADLAARQVLLTAGFDKVVTKPVTLERLARTIADLRMPAPDAARNETASGPAIVDSQVRSEMQLQLSAERVSAMISFFWEQLPRALVTIETARGLAVDRQLHALAGSAATLGYADVAATAQRCRGCTNGTADWHSVLASLNVALTLALRWDSLLVPDDARRRCLEALDGQPDFGRLLNV